MNTSPSESTDDLLRRWRRTCRSAWDLNLRYEPVVLGWGRFSFDTGWDHTVFATTLHETLTLGLAAIEAQS